MQFWRTLCAFVVLTVAVLQPATAQRYPGDDVTVNAGALGRGYLLYPGGKYGRSVRHLLQPGERPGARIHLRWPVHERVARSSPARPVTRIASVAPAKPPPKPVSAKAVSADLNALPEDSATRLVGPPKAAQPSVKPPKLSVQPMRTAGTAPPPADTGATMMPFALGAPSMTAAPAPRKRVATATPPQVGSRPSATIAAVMKKQSTVLFAAGAGTPAADDVTTIHTLAGTLNAALLAGATRIQLDAYGGPRGDKSSDSRRLSLKRALVVRELLIEDGVPSEKIDVRAMGGVDDNGVADRVDVFVRA